MNFIKISIIGGESEDVGMTIKVFDINENVYKEQLVPEDVDNIQKIFNKIFASSNTDHQKIECPISDFKQSDC